MKFSVLQQDLLPPLQAVSRVCGMRSTLPVLDNIFFAVEDKKLKIAATNLEIGVIKYLPVEIETPGEITVPARTITEVIASLAQGKIDLSKEGEIMTVSQGKFQAHINGIPSSEFPIIPLAENKGVDFPKEALLGSSTILFAAAVDEGRPVLTGVLTEVKEGKLDFVATDGFRLAHRQIVLPQNHLSLRALIPKRTFEELTKILQEEKVDNVAISLTSHQNQVVFSLGQTIVSSRLIEGQFPTWEKIIPEKILTRATIDKEELLKAIKLAAIFAKNEANIVILNTKKDGLTIKSSAKEVGSQENEIDGEVEGEDLQIAFNGRFLQDAITACPASQVMMEFSGPLSACMISPVGVEGLEYIVMPVRLS